MVDIFKYDIDQKFSSFYIKVSTPSKDTKIVSVIDYEGKKLLKINIKEKPIDGKANLAIIEFLATTFKIPKSSLEIKSGIKSKIKQVRAYNIDLSYLNSKFTSSLIKKN